MQLSLFGGTFMRLDVAAAVDMGDDHRRDKKNRFSAEVLGFNVHAGVTVRAGDHEGLERLCRYGARPAFSLEHLSILEGGRVAYLLRKPRRNGATHLVMTPAPILGANFRADSSTEIPFLIHSGASRQHLGGWSSASCAASLWVSYLFT